MAQRVCVCGKDLSSHRDFGFVVPVCGDGFLYYEASMDIGAA